MNLLQRGQQLQNIVPYNSAVHFAPNNVLINNEVM